MKVRREKPDPLEPKGQPDQPDQLGPKERRVIPELKVLPVLLVQKEKQEGLEKKAVLVIRVRLVLLELRGLLVPLDLPDPKVQKAALALKAQQVPLVLLDLKVILVALEKRDVKEMKVLRVRKEIRDLKVTLAPLAPLVLLALPVLRGQKALLEPRVPLDP